MKGLFINGLVLQLSLGLEKKNFLKKECKKARKENDRKHEKDKIHGKKEITKKKNERMKKKKEKPWKEKHKEKIS